MHPSEAVTTPTVGPPAKSQGPGAASEWESVYNTHPLCLRRYHQRKCELWAHKSIQHPDAHVGKVLTHRLLQHMSIPPSHSTPRHSCPAVCPHLHLEDNKAWIFNDLSRVTEQVKNGLFSLHSWIYHLVFSPQQRIPSEPHSRHQVSVVTNKTWSSSEASLIFFFFFSSF